MGDQAEQTQAAKEAKEAAEQARVANEATREELVLAHAKLQEQEDFINKLKSPPCSYAPVIKVYEHVENGQTSTRALISSKGDLSEVEVVLKDEELPRLKRGVTARILTSMLGSYIVDVVDNAESLGPIVPCIRALGADQVELELGGGTRVVAHGLTVPPEVGERLVLDNSGSVVTANLGKPPPPPRVNTTRTTWDDVGGLEEAKAAMIEAIEMPVKYADLYKKYNKLPVKGVLLYGAPGCGKTLLGRAAATAISDVNEGRGTESNFLYVKGPELLNMYVGNTEASIRSLFAQAREHKENHGYPAILFIDEADALLGARGGRGAHGGMLGSLSSTIVPQFLSEMDGLEDSGAIVLLSTNRADVLDPAIVREGRIDRKVRIGRPDQKATEAILRIHLKGKPLDSAVDEAQFAKVAAEALFAPDFVLYSIHRNDGPPFTVPFTLGHMVNGAMIAALVDQSTTNAINREIKGGTSGVSMSDFAQALISVFRANQHLNHDDMLQEFCEPFAKKVAEITRFRDNSDTNGNGHHHTRT